MLILIASSIFSISCSSTKDAEYEKLRQEIADLKKEKENQSDSETADSDLTDESITSVEKNNKATVKMNSGYLTMRDAPDAKTGKPIGKIPNGATLMFGGCQKEKVTIGGQTGRWCQANYKGQDGWVFDAWLETAGKTVNEPKTAKNSSTKFSDYPVTETYTGKNQPLILDDFSKNFKTRLQDAIKNGKPTFAGKYIVAGWGCGTGGCNTGAIIDATTGRAYQFPVGLSSVTTEDSKGEMQDYQEHEYKLDSRLMMFAGNLEGSEHTDGSDVIEYYEFRDGKFIFIKSMPYGKSN
jgi:uncharacterized protein YraI